MERAGRLIKNKKISQQLFSAEDLARAAWKTAVGQAIANHTSRLCLVRNKLVVEVEDAIWQRQLHTLSQQILNRLSKITGSQTIQELEFKIAVPRRQPQRALALDSTDTNSPRTLEFDEAEAIQDPVLKKVYRLSRKKATA